MNKIFPQGDANGNAAAGSKALPGGEADCSPCCYSRRGACLSAFLMLLLTTLAALIALVAILGPPSRTPGAAASRPAGSVTASAPVPTARTRRRPCAVSTYARAPRELPPTPALPAARLKLDHPERTRHLCMLLCLCFSHPVPVTRTHICPPRECLHSGPGEILCNPHGRVQALAPLRSLL
nr:low-density lipoprotein receptor class A domain-containing protein 1 isoform X3 [Odocoileus virginianus texanus]